MDVTDAMIHFVVGDHLYSYYGRIDVASSINYVFEKKHISYANLFYREGLYYKDNLNISLAVANIKEYEDLYLACFNPKTEVKPAHVICENDPTDTYIIQWKRPSGYIWRRVRQNIPYPSSVRYLKGQVEFSVQTEPYTELLDEMQSILINRKWNRSVIRYTVWN